MKTLSIIVNVIILFCALSLVVEQYFLRNSKRIKATRNLKNLVEETTFPIVVWDDTPNSDELYKRIGKIASIRAMIWETLNNITNDNAVEELSKLMKKANKLAECEFLYLDGADIKVKPDNSLQNFSYIYE